MYIGYTNEHTGHNERRTSRHDTHTYHHQKTHDWLTDWLGFSSIFSTIRLYRALKTYSLVNRLNAELSTKLMNNLTKPTLLKLSHLKGVSWNLKAISGCHWSDIIHGLHSDIERHVNMHRMIRLAKGTNFFWHLQGLTDCKIPWDCDQQKLRVSQAHSHLAVESTDRQNP